MRHIGLRDTQILAAIQAEYPEIDKILERAKLSVQHGKQEIYPYQAAVLYALAHRYDWEGANILEIGVYYGYSAAVLAQAAPLAKVTTLGIHEWECDAARKNLKGLINVKVVEKRSWDYLKEYHGPPLDMVFVDGDHKRIRLDFPWWNQIQAGGLLLFHDYSPNGSGRACPPAYRALCEFKEWLDRDFDVLVIDDNQVGMAGWYKPSKTD